MKRDFFSTVCGLLVVSFCQFLIAAEQSASTPHNPCKEQYGKEAFIAPMEGDDQPKVWCALNQKTELTEGKLASESRKLYEENKSKPQEKRLDRDRLDEKLSPMVWRAKDVTKCPQGLTLVEHKKRIHHGTTYTPETPRAYVNTGLASGGEFKTLVVEWQCEGKHMSPSELCKGGKLDMNACVP